MSQDASESYGAAKLDRTGRLVIPQSLRSKKGLQAGDELVFGIDEQGRIVISTFEEAIKAIQDAFCQLVPHDVSLVDELIAERRREAAMEENEDH